jgi:hypothetical protein
MVQCGIKSRARGWDKYREPETTVSARAPKHRMHVKRKTVSV